MLTESGSPHVFKLGGVTEFPPWLGCWEAEGEVKEVLGDAAQEAAATLGGTPGVQLLVWSVKLWHPLLTHLYQDGALQPPVGTGHHEGWAQAPHPCSDLGCSGWCFPEPGSAKVDPRGSTSAPPGLGFQSLALNPGCLHEFLPPWFSVPPLPAVQGMGGCHWVA